MTSIIPAETYTPATSGSNFVSVAQLALATVAPTSARVYDQTWRRWAGWAQTAGTTVLDLRPVNVLAFIDDQPTSKATRLRQLSAMRKLAQMLVVLDPSDEHRRNYEALKMVKAPKPAEGVGSERARRALQPHQADKLLRHWNGATSQHLRNKALIALLLLGGIRRSEAASLRWRDIDFETGVITVRHGKGDKLREVPLAGDFALDALREWQEMFFTEREYVFCPINKGGTIGADKPITGTDVYRIWDATTLPEGIESHPHDARRTFITEALTIGAELKTVQEAVGHVRAETTLGYAQSVDAKRAREELRLRYG